MSGTHSTQIPRVSPSDQHNRLTSPATMTAMTRILARFRFDRLPSVVSGWSHSVSAAPTEPIKKPEIKKTGANLKFNLPAGAALFVDGVKTTGDGAERTFYTPPLEAGQKYFYDVRAEIAIAGKTIVEEKRVVVEAGAEINESFPKVIAAIAAASIVAGK